MTEGYRDSQFKVTPGVWSGNGGISGERVNPPFNYTPSTVRVVSDPTNSSGLTPDQSERALRGSSSIKLQRGFMRNLSTKLGNIGTKTAPQAYKLRFQFNPATIQQNVEARQDMYLSVLQDPYQLTQPVAASTSFSFELLFDRTHEVMNGGVIADLMDKPGQSTTDIRSGEASDIGVLADLSVLYAIIGQGFTAGTATQQYNIIRANAEREYNRAVAAGDPLFTIAYQVPGDDLNGTKTIYKEKSDFQTYFTSFLRDTKFMESTGAPNEVNIGNSAFLVPMPVRIIFSALYMIDGYVMSTSVIFTKFNTNMVPIQCRVLLNVNAVYIGFARDKTFLSESIAQTGEQARQELLAAQKIFNDFCKGYGKNLSSYVVSLGNRPKDVAPSLFSDFPAGNPTAAGFAYTNSDKYGAYVTAGFYNAGDGSSASPVKYSGPSSSNKPKGSITDYYDDGNVVNIGHTVKVTVYGPYPTKQAANTAKPDPTKKVGEYTQTKSSATKDQWRSLTGDNTLNSGFFSIFSNNTASNAANPNSMTPEAQLQYDSGYFLFVADVSMTVSTPDGLVSQTKTASQKRTYQGNEVVGEDINGSKSWKFTFPPCTEVGSSKKNPYRDSFPGGN